MNAPRRVWTILAHVPLAIVAWASGLFVWNHFYARAPYLFDAGWFSATVFRAGPFARNPDPGMPYYWGWHPSLLVSSGSLLSYAFPGDRVEWYCVFQALVYAPLALAVPILVPKEERTGVGAALLTAACSLAFAFGGQVVAALGYPHFEIFSVAGVSIMLAALAMGRERLAWAGLVMSIATREDGGFHAASFLGAVLVVDLFPRRVRGEARGATFPIPRRRVITMFVVGIVATGILITIQKKLFVTVDAWTMYLAGKPAYAHLTKALLAERFAKLLARGGFLWVPFVATVAVAALRRDARYLLGWLATLPWFVLNICALQEIKGEISTYTGFPFVASAFWAAAYARACDRRPVVSGWRWPLLVAASLAAVSLVGLHAGDPVSTQLVLRDAFVPSATNPSGLEAFAKELRARRHGNVRMDDAMIAWALEAGMQEVSVERADGYAFFFARGTPDALAGTPFTRCGRVPRTSAFFCTRPERPLPSTDTLVASSPLLTLASMHPTGVRREGETVVIDPGPSTVAQLFGPYARYRPGRYVTSWDVTIDRCAADAPLPTIRFDVVGVKTGPVGARDVTPDEHTVEIAFEIPPSGGDDAWEFRVFSGPCVVLVKSVETRRIAP